MKRPLIITIGIVFILLVVAAWAFLLFRGVPEKPQDLFSDLGFTPQAERPIETATTTNNALVNVSGAALQQITLESVAGFTFATTSDGEFARFVESGTGHIYDINIATGVKTQITRTTVPNTIKAIFSPDALTVVFITHASGPKKIIVGEIPRNIDIDIQQTLLPEEAENIVFSDTDTLKYTLTTNGHTDGFSRNIATQTDTKLFSLPVPNLTLSWGVGIDKTYAYQKPTKFMEGFLYEVTKGVLTPTDVFGYGLSPFTYADKVVANTIVEKKYQSVLFDTTADTEITQSILMLPEKCAVDTRDNATVWCGTEFKEVKDTFLEDWYKGVVSQNDMIWRVTTSIQTAQLVIDPYQTTGRNIDISSITHSAESSTLLFINKFDNTLWLLDTTKI